jgi:hypothetical protein
VTPGPQFEGILASSPVTSRVVTSRDYTVVTSLDGFLEISSAFDDAHVVLSGLVTEFCL